MTLRLFTSGFSTFGRKVVLALELKGLAYEAIDALRREFRPELIALNPRAEVPVLTDGDVTVINSSDILQYLDWQYPQLPLYPAPVADKVTARMLERLADERFDPLVVDSSFWHWADRDDQPPPGLREAAQLDLEAVFTRLEATLAPRPTPWPFGAPGVVECAWYPNLVALKPMGFSVDEARFPHCAAWMHAMRGHPVFAADRKRTAAFLSQLASSNHERTRLFWSGARIEWLMARGFHRWLLAEIEADRTAFPPLAC